jgi:hypothetical protein
VRFVLVARDVFALPCRGSGEAWLVIVVVVLRRVRVSSNARGEDRRVFVGVQLEEVGFPEFDQLGREV